MVTVQTTPCGGGRSHPQLQKGSHSTNRRWLVELMQQINFGRIEGLVITDGDPVSDPPPRIIQEIKFGGDNKPRPEAAIDDFLLKAQTVELFCMFDHLHDGLVEVLVFKHGLPFHMEVKATA